MEIFPREKLRCTKNTIPFTAIGPDHAGEQENKKLKISEQLKGISRNLNTRTSFFICDPILTQIKEEMENMAGVKKKRCTLHHHVNKAHHTIQSSRVIQLVATFDKLGLSMVEQDDKIIYDIVTGKIFL